jgi:hypothetical protein
MNNQNDAKPNELLHKGLLTGNEGLNINPTGQRTALPTTTPKAPPPPPSSEKPKQG